LIAEIKKIIKESEIMK
jgi:protein mago nashi